MDWARPTARDSAYQALLGVDTSSTPDGRKTRRCFGQHFTPVLEMLDDFECDEKIERRVGEREQLAGALQEVNAGPREFAQGMVDGLRRNIHGDDGGGVGQFRGAVSGAAACVENTAAVCKARGEPVARQVLIEEVGIDEARYDALAGELKQCATLPGALIK